jgi:hypothetical protein
MKALFTFLLELILCVPLNSQPRLRTMLSRQPAVAGESFRIQYILENAPKSTFIHLPSFNGLRVVGNPDIYNNATVQNVVVTVEAARKGDYKIQGASAIVNGRVLTSEDIKIKVISTDEAINSNRMHEFNPEYFLGAGENPDEKIKQNLFLKVAVDRTSCFVGEPVTATFKLYSRLESRSDIIKNPGFYGFTVYDMVSLSNKEVTTEYLGGKAFDVHTVRKVQLFPLRPGQFTIDAMEVKNLVEFSRTAVNKRTEQQISEGVLGNNDDAGLLPGNTEIFGSNMHTEPIQIKVKELPEKNKPPRFNGAVGHFSISSKLIAPHDSSRQGTLDISLEGSGNFIQLNPPNIQWPVHMEGFEPVVIDSFDKKRSPLNGKRTYRYGFVASKGGSYSIPAVSMSYFNPDSGNYSTISSSKDVVNINEKLANQNVAANKKNQGFQSRWIWIFGILSVIVIISGTFLQNKKRKKAEILVKKDESPSIELFLQAAINKLNDSDHAFFLSLRQALWNFFAFQYQLKGSEMNRKTLIAEAKKNESDQHSVERLQRLLDECELGIFSGASVKADHERLINEARDLMERLS